MPPEIISLIGTAITALGLLIGVLYTQAQVKRAQKRTSEIEKSKVDAASYETARKNFESIIGAQGVQLERLSRDLDDAAEDLQQCKKRVNEMAAARERDAHNIRVLARYSRTLMRILSEGGIQFPEPPGFLWDD